ncbi:nucleoside-diphosphate-sugar epimerase [Ameyamaea chiangmaiensis NBRC 103196]|uniref:SDR family oxidoreductase n=1 Tax=Ameyamaea chiangmaiensis TaxID=442969 RepID=A0A850PEB8_9PROT|nr:D-erythronate dehydrogenase [Ameyamaea chiangmaiensis]MBS4075589.1 SDR family oxidoreductase [Ameyamaea chiangmaiensis]NVN40282.1 SDR family oxidoreductase [Ameyamaea chiangmaiensis]GBQ70845.1 nucleoside-diphosphate-sugar epimerase [Ameyamaea chiangmaiensis NBRC 103196]
MHVLIIGAAGMIGRKLAESFASRALAGSEPKKLTLADVFTPSAPAGFSGDVVTVQTDLAASGAADQLLAERPDVIFHLAAIVSGEAEARFEFGYHVNLDGTRALFEAIRKVHEAEGWTPRVIYSSAIGVFGGGLPDVISDEYIVTPEGSYGTQKAMCELLLSDYSRRGFFDGIGVRLPTICVRPGKPNKAASSFFSGIIREPLVGQEAILPVAETERHWMTSPRSAVQSLRHAMSIDTTLLGSRRNLNMPGLSVTVGEQIEALRHIAGDKAVALIRREPDPIVTRFVQSWPKAFDTKRANELGFTAECRFEDIIRAHIEDELTPKAT